MSTVAPEVLTVPIKWAPGTRSATTSRKLVGTAAVFGQTADRLGFPERIQRGAFADAIRDGDPFLVFAHDDTAILARKSAGTLRLHEDAKGLQIEADVVNTTLGSDVLELVRTGHLSEMSFAMSDVEDEYVNGERVIKRVGTIWECTICPLGAYSQTSVEARASQALLARVERVAGARPRVTAQDRSPYGEGSKFSFYRDLAVVEDAKAQKEARFGSPHYEREVGSSALESNMHGGLEDARKRLASVQTRDIGTTAAAGFVPVTAGGNFVADLFETSVRAQAVIASALTPGELPLGGLVVTAPRITSGATVAVHTENAAVSETDPAMVAITGTVTTAAGMVDISQQAIDQSPGGLIDRAISEELGRALGANLDAGVMTALLAASGIVSVTYVDASPTLPELLSKLMDLRQKVHTQLGEPPDLVLMHPQRRAWIDAALDTSNRPMGLEVRYGANVLESPTVPQNLGGSTTEDRIAYAATSHIELLSRPATLRIMFEVLSATLTVRIQVYQYSALMIRQPLAFGVLSGTGMIVQAL